LTATLQTYPRPNDPVLAFRRPDGTTYHHSEDHGRSMDMHENPKHHGAKFDGVSDDTDAWLETLERAAGGKVFFPLGTSIVSPSASTQLLFYGNTTIEGAGPGSILKVADGTGNYPTLFKGASSAEDNVTFRNFTIDQNADNVAGAPVGDASAHNLIRFEGGIGHIVESMRFFGVGINGITAGASVGGEIRVSGNYFRFQQIGGVDYDNSVVYLECDGQVVSGNIFEAALAEFARACIESHGGHSTISGNVSRGFQTLCNIVTRIPSFDDFDSNDIAVTGNSIVDAQFGIALWSVTGKALRNVVVADNAISLNNADRFAAGVPFSDMARGITMTLGNPTTGEYEGINIHDNVIRFQQEDRVLVNPELSAGVLLVPQGSTKGINCSDNTIINAPTAGIRLAQNDAATDTWHRNVRIEHNIIIDAGSNALAAGGYRVGILASGKLDTVDIFHNTIVDTGGPHVNTLNGIAWYPDASSLRCRSGQNRLVGSDSALTNIVGTPAEDEEGLTEALANYIPSQVVLDDSEGGLGTSENLLLRSEQFDNAAWSQQVAVLATVTANATTSPTGAATADEWLKNNDSNYFVQTVTGLAAIGGRTFTCGIWVKGDGASIGRSVSWRVDDGVSENVGGTSLRSVTLTSEWQLLTHTYTFSDANAETQLRVVFFSGDMVSGEDCFLWGGQLMESSALGRYALTTGTAAARSIGLSLATGKVLAGGGIGVGNSAAATEVLGTSNQACVKKIEVFDAAGTSIGFVPVYAGLT
jgi:hypothetical protein